MLEVGMTDVELERRKRLVGIGPEDLQRVALIRDIVERHVDELTAAFFEHLGRVDSRVQMHADLTREARPLKRDHLLAMVRGRYDRAYVEQRIRLGLVYGRHGLETSVFLGAYHHLLATIGRTIMGETDRPASDAFESFMSLRRVGYFDLSLQIEVLMHERERLIRQQAQSIRALSTPVLQIRDRMLLMAMIGVIDAERARLITDSLLAAIRRTRALVVVLDITGVANIDEVVASQLSRTMNAARFMGTSLIVSGISEQVTQAMHRLRTDFVHFKTVVDLQDGIEEAERLLAPRRPAADREVPEAATAES